jgi:hypothetical protein
MIFLDEVEVEGRFHGVRSWLSPMKFSLSNVTLSLLRSGVKTATSFDREVGRVLSIHFFTTMAAKTVPSMIRTVLPLSRTRFSISGRPFARSLHHCSHQPALSSTTYSTNRHHPVLRQNRRLGLNGPSIARRTIFIQTQSTPNDDVSSTSPWSILRSLRLPP